MSLLEKLDSTRIPKHIAIIMDGNGRWAEQRGKRRVFGHENGVGAVKATIKGAAKAGVKYLTLYAFSTENWQRPKNEVEALMRLLVHSLNKEINTLLKNNIKLTLIGDLTALPKEAAKGLLKGIEKTKNNTGLTLVLALSYSARWELTRAMQNIAKGVADGKINPESITEQSIISNLNTHSIPDPELLIRTSGEMRISNFLLWQIAYAELYFTPTLWPDFNEEHLYQAILDFQHRERRFGLTSKQLKPNNNTEK